MSARVEIQTIERSPRIEWVSIFESTETDFAMRYAVAVARPISRVKDSVRPRTRVVNNRTDEVLYDSKEDEL